NLQRVYWPLSAPADFSQQRVKREWFGDNDIFSYHRISQHLGLAANHGHWDVPRSWDRPEFGQHGEAGLLVRWSSHGNQAPGSPRPQRAACSPPDKPASKGTP